MEDIVAALLAGMTGNLLADRLGFQKVEEMEVPKG
jgi:hypothetical protein